MPAPDYEVRDPRIRRTHQLLQRSLQKLMQTRPFDEISVQEIAEASTVGRATFYRHYTDKFTLFNALIESNFQKSLQQRGVSFDGTRPETALALILATCDHLVQTHADTGAFPARNAFEPLMESAMIAVIRRILIYGMTEATPSTLQVEIAAAAGGWAIYGAVKQWFDTPNHVPAEEIAPFIFDLLLPILRIAPAPH